MSQSCSTCRFAEFEWTKHKTPRVKDQWSTCTAPIDVSTVRLPECVYPPGGLHSILERSRHCVWPYQGKDCATYEERKP